MFKGMTDEQLLEFIQEFIHKNRKKLHSIARKTKGDLTFEEITGEIWLLIRSQLDRMEKMATAHAEMAVDAQLSIILDADWVKERQTKSIKRYQKTSLDAPLKSNSYDESEHPKTLADMIRASEDIGPLQILLSREQSQINEKAIKGSYSEACAYVLLFRRFLSEEKIIDQLKISTRNLRQKIAKAFWVLEHQRMLFDGLSHINPRFPFTVRRQRSKSNICQFKKIAMREEDKSEAMLF